MQLYKGPSRVELPIDLDQSIQLKNSPNNKPIAKGFWVKFDLIIFSTDHIKIDRNTCISASCREFWGQNTGFC